MKEKEPKITKNDFEKIDEIVKEILSSEKNQNSVQYVSIKKWLNYSLDVIKGRALPNILDGLKPVQRRILVSMKDLSINPSAAPKKSARIVGSCIGTLHPHGDSSVYEAMVNMTQPFSKLVPLIEGQGNFGSIDGDNAAAMRYCVTGNTILKLANGEMIRIDSISENEEANIDLDIVSVNKKTNKAVKFFNSGKHEIYSIETEEGFSLSGSENHPILVWDKDIHGFPMISWKILSEITTKDYVIIDKSFFPDKNLNNSFIPYGKNAKSLKLIKELFENNYYIAKIRKAEKTNKMENVYSIKVDSHCHSFVANGFINHNTEARFSKEGYMFFQDYDKNVVPTDWNYDNTIQEPLVLPVPYPNLLINGVPTGIAVGIATSIPPHNPNEVFDALLYVIKQKKAEKEISAEKIAEYILAPDFPTGGIIYNRKNMLDIIKNGRGSISLRAKHVIESVSKTKKAIIITEIPFQKNKSKLVEQIADLVKEKKIDTIAELRDQSNKKGIKIYIELKANTDPEYTWNFLLKNTELDVNINYNMVVIENEEPKEVGIVKALDAFVDFRQEVLINKYQFILKAADLRIEILSGLIKALESIDKVIKIIKASETEEEAISKLKKTLSITERQSKAILDMKIQRLLGLEKLKLEKELTEQNETKKDAESILFDTKKQFDILTQEAKDTKKILSKQRLSIIDDSIGELVLTKKEINLAPKEECIVYISQKGYVKKENLKQRNGLKGIALQEDDFVIQQEITDSHKIYLFITDKGNVFSVKVSDLPDTEKGRFISNVVDIHNEKVIFSKSIEEFNDEKTIIMVTKSGLIKKSSLSDYSGSIRATGIIGINLSKEDSIVFSSIIEKDEEIILFNSQGYLIRFSTKEVPLTGRNSKGVIGMKLKKGHVINAILIEEKDSFISISEKGTIKTNETKDFKVQGRAGIGVLSLRFTDKTGDIVFVEKIKNQIEDYNLICFNGMQEQKTFDLKDYKSLAKSQAGTKLKIEKSETLSNFSLLLKK